MSENGLPRKRISIKSRDLIDIGETMTDEESSSYLDLETMEVIRIINGFDAEIEDEELKQQIEEGLDTFPSINGKGAYRRFKDILLEHEDYREQWFAFQAAWQETRAREWLEGEGFEIKMRSRSLYYLILS
ncbi:MAG TPA: UPF0158 family protein [Candidatus Lokiarchaeia archaeon]|nr:UPF0158 family protein [Candidatus Lokiarchaeia archaeon]